MAVPITTVDKYRGLQRRKHNVRRAGKISAMKAEPEAKLMKQFSDGNLGSGVSGSNGLHDPPALGWGAGVDHGQPS